MSDIYCLPSLMDVQVITMRVSKLLELMRAHDEKERENTMGPHSEN